MSTLKAAEAVSDLRLPRLLPVGVPCLLPVLLLLLHLTSFSTRRLTEQLLRANLTKSGLEELF